ncbi:MAG: hypothetical protein SXG53_14170 [Pseudomonadota bacterium]|nr:hypothetical protein [Pseudomonadota bacterium]
MEQNIVLMPTSEPLAGIEQWPAVFFGRGLWDFAESLEATLELKGLVASSIPYWEASSDPGAKR